MIQIIDNTVVGMIVMVLGGYLFFFLAMITVGVTKFVIEAEWSWADVIGFPTAIALCYLIGYLVNKVI